MTLSEQQEQSKLQSYAEALRYMSNAEETLQKAGKENNRYLDPKYVSSACGIAYKGVLKALNAWLAIKGAPVPTKRNKTKRHRSIDMYRYDVGRLDRKMLEHLNIVYDVLHLAGYYDEIQDAIIIRRGFEYAYEIIARIKPNIQEEELQNLLANYRKPSFIQRMYMLLV